MHSTPRSLLALAVALLLGAAGCSQHTPSTSSGPSATAAPQSTHAAAAAHPKTSDDDAGLVQESTGSCPDPEKIAASERDRASCFHLQPARTVVQKRAAAKTKKTAGKTSGGRTAAATKGKAPQKNAAAKSSKTAKTAKGKEIKPTAAKTAVKTTTKTATNKHGKQNAKPAAAPEVLEYRTVGLCQPQSLIYARCRTGIKTCQLGDTSPVQWFACARKNGATTAIPTAGSVIVLDANSGRNMPTGHPAYVEEVAKNQDGTWTLRISHTNYDRKCHLDQDATVLFDPKRMTASFESGPWGPWAKNLKVMGFILQ